MSDAQAIALSGLKTQAFHINTLAQNLANLNTHNYKTTELTFADVLEQNQRQSTHTGLGTVIAHTTKNFAQGPLIPSEHWNHVAIEGPGFFQVEGLDNQEVYTRNSHLTLDAEHYLATEEGFRLSAQIQIPEEALQVTIRKNGEVEVTFPDQTEPQIAGSIQLATFVNPGALNPHGSGLYTPTAASGDALVNTPGNPGTGELLQHHLEGSNVDMLNTLMQLTMAQRIYQLNAKAMQITDEMEKMTNEIRS